MGRGISWGFQHKQCSYCVLSSGDSTWDESGPLLWQRDGSSTSRPSRRSARSRGLATTPGVSRTGDLDGHRSRGGSSQTGLLRREARPFSPSLNLAAAGQSNGGSLMTTHAAAAAAAASTTVDAPAAQQQQRQPQEPRQQTGFGEDGQPHQEGGGEQAQEDQNFNEAERQGGTS